MAVIAVDDTKIGQTLDANPGTLTGVCFVAAGPFSRDQFALADASGRTLFATDQLGWSPAGAGKPLMLGSSIAYVGLIAKGVPAGSAWRISVTS
jgi:hypothetical protein